jgi:hypothetical protein
MKLSDRFKRWWKPAQWEEDHPLSEEERDTEHPPEDLVHGQIPMGAGTYDRVDVERDFHKP